MVCEHLRVLEEELVNKGITLNFRGQAWSSNCREWVYFDCYLDCKSIIKRLNLPACVSEHFNDDPKSGTERGLVCSQCKDAVVGFFEPSHGKPIVS